MSELERITEEYMSHLRHVEALNKIVAEYKKQLSDAVDAEGEEDDKGHKWLQIGPFMLQKQRRQGNKSLNIEAAEEWAKERGIWEKVSDEIRVLNEDALMAYVYDHRDEAGIEDEVQNLYKEAPVSYAFMKPVEEATYDY